MKIIYKRLIDAGFDEGHISEIVLNTQWQEKALIKYFKDEIRLKKFIEAIIWV